MMAHSVHHGNNDQNEVFIYNGGGGWSRDSLSKQATNVAVAADLTKIEESRDSLPKQATNVAVSADLTKIEKLAFRGFSAFTNIFIPPSVTVIEEGAFQNCSSLTAIDLPSSIQTVGRYAFGSCSSLASLTLPLSITAIKAGTFFECSSLTSVTIPARVRSFGLSAFAGCNSLSSIELPSSLKIIADDAFYMCQALHSITLPPSINYLIIMKSPYYFATEINESMGSLYCVVQNEIRHNVNEKLYESRDIAEKLIKVIELDNEYNEYNRENHSYSEAVYVNWEICSKVRNAHNGRLPLYTAIEENVQFSSGLCDILQANGAAIEDVDPVTRLEAFMLAAVGPRSNMETVYKLLEDYPPAIIPYVRNSH